MMREMGTMQWEPRSGSKYSLDAFIWLISTVPTVCGERKYIVVRKICCFTDLLSAAW